MGITKSKLDSSSFDITKMSEDRVSIFMRYYKTKGVQLNPLEMKQLKLECIKSIYDQKFAISKNNAEVFKNTIMNSEYYEYTDKNGITYVLKDDKHPEKVDPNGINDYINNYLEDQKKIIANSLNTGNEFSTIDIITNVDQVMTKKLIKDVQSFGKLLFFDKKIASEFDKLNVQHYFDNKYIPTNKRVEKIVQFYDKCMDSVDAPKINWLKVTGIAGVSVGAVITTTVIIINKLNENKNIPSSNTTAPPSISTTITPTISTTITPTFTPNKGLTPDDLKLLSLTVSTKISGCYMFSKNSKGELIAEKLNDCSDWYNNFENQLYCSCMKISDTKTSDITSFCTDSEICKSPFCLNQNSICQTSNAKKCTLNDNKPLYMCNGNSIDDEDFVLYAYQYYPPESIYATITNLSIELEQPDNNNFIKIIIISVIIMIIIFIVIYIMMNRKVIKSKRKK